ncbi:MAG TPA: NAD(P)-dependent oxidoreductase [Terriglobales bacterium]|nr:NAD(P)-dependent oxidoreductase [Terriglobales bacterium]
MAAKRQSRPYVVLGAGGQLGQAFLQALGGQAVGLERAQLELGDAAALERALDPLAPEVVINTAAFNHVDLAEAQRQRALAANFLGPAQLARLARARGWRLLHFSTDYVFGGDGLARPRVESDPPAPVNFYGYSKLLGEEAVLRADPTALVARVAHLYGGPSLSPGRANLVQRFLEQARAGQPLWVTRGQTLNPTSVRDLVPASLRLLAAGAQGLFHLTGGGACDAEAFAREVLRLAGLEAEIRVVERDTRPAPRATYTVLENRRLADEGYPPLPPWRESLAAYVAALGPPPT